jgi:hypothetical protein
MYLAEPDRNRTDAASEKHIFLRTTELCDHNDGLAGLAYLRTHGDYG